MEKFLKSLFSSSEKKKDLRENNEEDNNDFTPPMDERRKLSISRSGRMKHANKKRSSLTTDLYGQNDFQPAERPKNLEYHVDKKFVVQERRKSDDDKRELGESKEQNNNKKELTPEEQIETAFDVIHKDLLASECSGL